MPNQLTAWDQVYSTKDTNEILAELASMHLSEVLDKTVREWIHGHVGRGDFHYLCNLGVDYQWLSSPIDAYHVRQVLAFYQKRADLDIGIDKRGVALSTFKASESLCGETNHIFKSWAAGRFQFRPSVERILHAAQRKIAQVLGGVPSLADIPIRFGPGATTAVKKKDANPRNKLASGIQCSANLVHLLPDLLAEMPGWFIGDPGLSEDTPVNVVVEIHDAKLVCVPKTAKTDRTVGVEPSLNTMFQLGIGTIMAERLAAVGLDLKDQSKNQRLARYGSLTGELATLDLSSASDTIATELVAHLLPLDWYLLLDALRCPYMEVPGEGRVRLQKFSSMGNGFTFPLETLIFWALASSCCEKSDFWCTVYGDDIIVPTYAYGALVEVLEAVGFIPNRSKSFASGPFRESCGKDYLLGFDIRPCYIKGPLSGESLFVLHNYYVRNSLPEYASLVLAYIHPVLRKWGPDGYGDGHLLGDWERVPHPLRSERGYGGYVFETYTRKPKRQFLPALPGDRVLPAYSIYASTPGRERASMEGGDHNLRLPAFWSGLLDLDDGSRYIYDRKGRLGCSLPGSHGYKLVSIYTLKPM